MSELQTWIEALGQVGLTPGGGVFRGSYMPAELEAHELVSGWMREAGLKVRRDAMGNLWGRAEGTVAGAPAVVTGSHLDSVPNGGNYDGPYGVLGGLMAVRDLLRQYGQPTLPLEVVAFTGEEASRFPIGLMGSRAVAGTLDRRLLDEASDSSGIRLADAMRQVGLDPDRLGEARRQDIAAYLEMHIEQARVLESRAIPIGIVQTIVGIQHVLVTVHGRADHAGATPMHLRLDALQGAVQMIRQFPELAARSDGGVMTVGRFSVSPGATNVVPETVTFSIDIRHRLPEVKRQMVERARAVCHETAEGAGLRLTWEPILPAIEPVPLSERIQGLLRESCREQNIPHLDMVSGGGHDAMALAAQAEVGLIFIPCQDGRSHTPDEFAAASDMDAGVAVLSRCLYQLAYQNALGGAR